ncbi:MAG: tetratricopeptide repeat protein [Bacillati bacterium ANGP1]|uniref:Tetratricopeptide repeat protein n=1 Tax=Candidatus Segetimicrobium genomatis TaxID=2569760 RepID=A0A537JCG0_9BACT|nr:MAG: tetratricopeptide repeat protein [Terrabacteria group bacterium ANGP1]
MPRLTLGQRLRRARQAKGLTQEALGKPTLTKGFISLLEHDRAQPSVATLEWLSARLGQPVSYFLDGQDAVSDKMLAMLGSRGRGELSRRQYEAARKVFAELVRLAAGGRNEAVRIQAELGLGEALLGLRRLEEAGRHLTRALRAGRAAGAAPVECRALRGLGTVAYRRGQFLQAMSLYKEALRALPRLGGAEPQLAGEIHLYLGTTLGQTGHLDEAVEAYTQAREWFEGAQRPEQVGEALMGLGNILSAGGELEGAQSLYERARALFEQHEDLEAIARVRSSLGMVLMQGGRPREAVEHFQASLAISRRLENGADECRALAELARCLFVCGDRAQAAEFAERAVARSREVGRPDEGARAGIVLGVLAAERGDTEVAVGAMQEAAAQCRRSGMAVELVTIYRELARLAGRQGRHEEAAAYHEQAFEALQAVRSTDTVAAIHLADPIGLRAKALPTPKQPR